MPLETYAQGLLSAAVKAESLMLEAEMNNFPIPEFQIPEIPSSFIEACSTLLGKPIQKPKIGDTNIQNCKIQKRGRERDQAARLAWEKTHPE